MIKYNLKCHRGHEFESWFSDSKEFDNLNRKKLLECIFCNSKKIKKSIMAPMVRGAKDQETINEISNFSRSIKDQKNQLIEIRNYIEKNFEYVGEDFSKKVREIYYDKKRKKTIYGTATLDERKELEEEGINLVTVPWISKDN